MTRIHPLFLDNNIYFAGEMRTLIEGIVPGGGSWGHQPFITRDQNGNYTMTIQIPPGCSYVPDTNLNPLYTCVSDAPENVTLGQAPNTPPPSGSNRIDLIILRPRPDTNDWIFDIVPGTAAASPTRPATPPGTLAICAQTLVGGQNTLTPGPWNAPNLVDLRRPPISPVNVRSYWMQNTANIDLTLGGNQSSLIHPAFVAPYTKLYGQGSKLIVTMHVSGCLVLSGPVEGIWHSLEFTHGTGIGLAPIRVVTATAAPPAVDASGSGTAELLNVPYGPYNVVPNIRADQNTSVRFYGNSHQISVQIMEAAA